MQNYQEMSAQLTTRVSTAGKLTLGIAAVSKLMFAYAYAQLFQSKCSIQTSASNLTKNALVSSVCTSLALLPIRLEIERNGTQNNNHKAHMSR
jgi:hypothetical protein